MSSSKIFSIIKNTEKYVKSKELDIEVDALVHEMWYSRQPEFIKRKCKQIFNLIESNHFTYNDLIIFLLHTYIFSKNVKYIEINEQNINSIKTLYGKKQYEKEKQKLLSINTNVKLNGIEDFLTVNQGGTNYLYDLIKKKYINPIMFVNVYSKLNFNSSVAESSDYKRFKRIIQKIKRHMTHDTNN